MNYDVIGIDNAPIRLLHGIVDDLEKVRVGWQLAEVVEISPMTVIVGISEAITGYEVSVFPHQAKFLADLGMPLLAVSVTLTVMTGENPGIRYHYCKLFMSHLAVKLLPLGQSGAGRFDSLENVPRYWSRLWDESQSFFEALLIPGESSPPGPFARLLAVVISDSGETCLENIVRRGKPPRKYFA